MSDIKDRLLPYRTKYNQQLISYFKYVDDLTIMGKKRSCIDAVTASLRKTYSLRDLGAAKYLLGIQIKRNPGHHAITLHQETYASEMLVKYRMEDCKPISTPMEPHDKLTSEDSPTTPARKDTVPYRQAIGSLLYLVS